MNLTDRCNIEHVCERLSHDFGYHLDQRDYAALANLFAADGVWIRHGDRLQGREQLLAAMADRPADRFARHIVTNIHFAEVTADRVRAVVYNISYFAKHLGELPAAFVAGQSMIIEFWDRYVLTADGWRIQERENRPVLVPAHMHDEMMGRH
jgi:uncharacterized protein (TIGR02246 family)